MNIPEPFLPCSAPSLNRQEVEEMGLDGLCIFGLVDWGDSLCLPTVFCSLLYASQFVDPP